MIIKKLAAFTFLAIVTSASVFSQTSREIAPINFEGESGLFISFPVMDSISVKLLERSQLKRENAHVWALYFNSQREKFQLEQKLEIAESSSQSWETLFNGSEIKGELLRRNFEAQKELTRITKKKARKNGLVLLGGGFTLGLLASLLLIN